MRAELAAILSEDARWRRRLEEAERGALERVREDRRRRDAEAAAAEEAARARCRERAEAVAAEVEEILAGREAALTRRLASHRARAEARLDEAVALLLSVVEEDRR